MKVLIPPSETELKGPFVTAEEEQFEIRGRRGKAVLIEFTELPEDVDWFEEFELMYCQEQHGPDTVKVIRPATDEERALFRVPLWIQDEEIPECCGQPMFFVGQIDDDQICMEVPEGAKTWWHDKASFYVFTCPQCLESKAVGQQM